MPTYHTFHGGSGPPPWSRSCTGDRHGDCGHLLSVARSWGIRPAVLLCLCTCHSECPLADGLPLVTREVWPAQCVCPGADLAAAKLDEAEREEVPDFAEFEWQRQDRRARSARESQQRRTARREAFEATRAASAGKNRAAIREIYMAELRARGLTIPSDLVLDATADAVARDRDKFSVTYSVRVLAEMGRDFRKLFSHPGPR
jgi:hypothetical protein